MRILFLLPDFPYPPSTGGRLKVFNILRHLSDRHQCDILCFDNSGNADRAGLSAALPAVRILGVFPRVSGAARWIRLLRNLALGLPPSFASFSPRKYVAVLKGCLTEGDYDLVHYDIVNMAQYVGLNSEIPSVHSPNDATSLVYFRMAAGTPWSLSKLRLLTSAFLFRRFERRTYHLFNKVHVVSQDDAEYLTNLVPKVDIATILIPIDDRFLDIVEPQGINRRTLPKCPTIVCTGNLGNPAIAEGVREFATVALPIIVRQVPNVRFVVLGQNVSKALHDQLTKTSNIELLAWVEDYREFLGDADVVLVPDKVGAPGAKTRTLVAMGLGLPVVGTATAFAGIQFVNREHGLLYKTTPECAELILSLLNSSINCEYLGLKARQLVADAFSLSVVGPKYESLYLDAIAKFSSQSSRS
ncbi:MAG: glycosyltransferase family 4 protein [Sulfuritalea sp.]|nr:glycosyltransferase family 4 protein [Sulfuritalea sp.]